MHDSLVQLVNAVPILSLSNALHDIDVKDHALFLERLRRLFNPSSDVSEDRIKLDRRLAELLASLRSSNALTEEESELVSKSFATRPILLEQLQDLIYQKCSEQALCAWICSVLPRIVDEQNVVNTSSSPDGRSAAWPAQTIGRIQADHGISCSVPVRGTLPASPPLSPAETPPSSRAADDLRLLPAPISMNLDRSRYATKQDLVLTLIGPREQLSFRNMFFLCYRPFIKPPALLNQLLAYYEQPPVDSMSVADDSTVVSRLKIISVLSYWMEQYFHIDFDEAMITILDTFIDSFPADDTKIDHLRRRREACRRGVRSRRRSSSLTSPVPNAKSPVSPPLTPLRSPASGPALSPLGSPPPLFDCLAYRPLDLAKALTLNDWAAYSAIEDTELIDQAWKSAPHRAQNALAFVQRFNRLSYWVAHTILTLRKREARAHMFQHFVAVGIECLKMRNYHATFAIAAAFMLHPVARLKELRFALDGRFAALLEQLQRFTDSTDNYHAYRTALRQQITMAVPCVPHMAITFKDVFVVQEISPIEKHEKVADLTRLNRIAEQIGLFNQTQIHPYDAAALACPAPVQSALSQLLSYDNPEWREENLLKRSLSLEPKMTWAQYRDAVAIAILKNEGFL